MLWWTQTGASTWDLIDRELPDVPDAWKRKFQQYRTKEDVMNSPPPVFHSPTSSFVTSKDVEDPTVYCDQQGCVVWVLDKDGRVTDTRGTVVSETLAEFYARMDLDNRAWYILNNFGDVEGAKAEHPHALMNYIKEAYQ